MRFNNFVAALAVVGCLSAASLASTDDYTLDDGLSNGSGFSFGRSGEMIILNQFTVLPGKEVITAISVVWRPVDVSHLTDKFGDKITLYVWDDPDNDGDPADAVVLATSQGIVPSGFEPSTSKYAIGPVNVGTVGDSFFVGYRKVFEETSDVTWLGCDSNSVSRRSYPFWFYSTCDPDDLASCDGGFPSAGCNWMIRANAVEAPPSHVPAVSEWGMASVVLLLLTGLTIKFGMVRFSRKAA